MELLQQKVCHIKFGTGIIMGSQEKGRLEVLFEGKTGTKIFHYPEAFEKFLKFERETLQEEAERDLAELERQKQEKEERERIKQARIERYKKQFMEQFLRNQRSQASK